MSEKGEKSPKESQNEINNRVDPDKQTNAEEGEREGEREGEGERNNKEEFNNFSYLESNGKEPSIFEFKVNNVNDENQEQNIFKPDSLICKYAICILLKSDSNNDSNLLKYTLDGIFDNFPSLDKFEIDPKNINIYIFVNQINNNNLVKEETINEKLKEDNKDNYLLTHYKLKNDERDYQLGVICKRNYMSEIESLNCFYCYIVKNIKTDDKIIITSVITAGVKPNKEALSNLIQSCFIQDRRRSEGRDCISVPALEIDEEMEEKNFFDKIIKYERVHFNIYNMNYYKSTGIVPVLSLLNTMCIDKYLLKQICDFYNEINVFDYEHQMTIDYHDYNLGLHLYKNKITVNYINSESLGTILYRDFNYRDKWLSKYSGYYSNFFSILKTLIICDLPIKDKLFTIFQIMGMAFEYIYPSLSVMVINAIFIEAFDEYNTSSAWFMTLLYIIMYIGSGTTVLICQNSKEALKANNIYYFFMEIYYLFILICSIVAMDNIKKRKLWGNKDFEEYKFNNAACGCLIVFTFIISIIPIILRKNMILKQIVPMLIYFVFGAPSSTSSLLIGKIWKAPGESGGENTDDRKGINILFFFLFNLFIGFLIPYNYNREKRANAVMGLGIFYLIYLFFKIIGIILSMMKSPVLSENKKREEKIKNILNGKEVFQSRRSDVNSDNAKEEKLDDSGNNNVNKSQDTNNEEENRRENDNNEEEGNDNNNIENNEEE